MIALFDSGYGGLTVLKPIIELLPEYDYVYLGDNARVPYGNHSSDSIKKFSEEAVEYLFNRGAKLIIFACNTASSVALKSVQQKYLNAQAENERKILGVLIPVAQKAVQLSKIKRIGVIGTRATVESKVYEKEIHKLDPNCKVYQQACPLLVSLIEENWHHRPEAVSILKSYLRPLKSCNTDSLILGCTHYPLMEKEIKKVMGKKVQILSSGSITAASLKDYLHRHPEIESKLSKKRTRTFLTTEDPKRFKSFTEKNFGMKIKMPEKISLN